MHTALLLEMAAEAFPDRAAVGAIGVSISFAELAARARAGGAWLTGQGPGQVVFLGLGGPAVTVALFASAEIGRPFAPLNYRLPDDDLVRLVARTAPSVAIVDDDMLGRLTAAPGVVLAGRGAFEAACLDPAWRAAARPEVDADVAVLLFTSGTTGEPKAAVLRHRHLASYVISTVEFMHADADEAMLVSVPPYHIAGIASALTAVYAGRRAVHLPLFSAQAWIDTAVKERITHAMLVPTMLARVLAELEERGQTLPNLRALSYGGGRMPAAVIERAMRLLPQVAFVNGYGLTETSSTVAVLTAEDHRAAIASADPKVRRRLGSVGRALPSVELEVRGPDGKPLGPGLSGEVFVRGEQIAGEYLAGEATCDQGWFATRDAGWLDAEGYLFVEGRLDDVIVRAAENISPGEIEDVLRAHPGVVDVAVLGAPDETWGERIAAVVVARADPPSTSELASFVRARLRSTRTPEIWEFRSELPYNDTGKLLRRVLRDELAKAAANASPPPLGEGQPEGVEGASGGGSHGRG